MGCIQTNAEGHLARSIQGLVGVTGTSTPTGPTFGACHLDFTWRFNMKRSIQIAAGIATSLVLGFTVATALAHTDDMPAGMMHNMGRGPMMGMGAGFGSSGHGPMMGPTAMLTKQDAGSSADMGLVLELLANNDKIMRSVTNLPDGIRTLTESDDPQVAQAIKAHVADMDQRLQDGREFNIFSLNLPVLFANREKIVSKVEVTERGSIVTQTSTDAKVVAALQAHASEVTGLVQEGMVAMRRGMMQRMAMGPAGLRSRMAPPIEGSGQAPASPDQTH